MNSDFEQAFKNQNISVINYETKPAPLNNILWSVTGQDANNYYVGYKSFLDKPKPILFQVFKKDHELLTPYLQHEDVQKILKLNQGWYSVEIIEQGLKINDLRFGTNTAWKSGGDFVFSYLLEIENNKIISIEEGEKTFRDKPSKILSDLFLRMIGLP